MTDNRPTVAIETPNGKELVLKKYLTARERNELRAIIAKKMTLDPQSGEAKINEITGDILEEQERKLIELVVVSYDGSNADILNRLLDGTPEEYDFVTVEAGKANTNFLAQTK